MLKGFDWFRPNNTVKLLLIRFENQSFFSVLANVNVRHRRKPVSILITDCLSPITCESILESISARYPSGIMYGNPYEFIFSSDTNLTKTMSNIYEYMVDTHLKRSVSPGGCDLLVTSWWYYVVFAEQTPKDICPDVKLCMLHTRSESKSIDNEGRSEGELLSLNFIRLTA